MNRFLPISLLATTAIMALAAPAANAAIYMTVDGIKGSVASAREIGFSLNSTEATSSLPAGHGTGKTMAAEVLASSLGHTGGANLLLADGSVRFIN